MDERVILHFTRPDHFSFLLFSYILQLLLFYSTDL